MNNVSNFDKDYLLQLATVINSGWHNLYQAIVEDKIVYIEQPNGESKQFRLPAGRMVVRYIPERTRNEAHYHFVTVELQGDMTLIGRKEISFKSDQLSVVSDANYGLIKTQDMVAATEIVNYQVDILQKRKSHFVMPPASYCDLPHLFEIDWGSSVKPWADNPEYMDFKITGSVQLTPADTKSIPAVEGIDDFSKWIVEMLCPVDSFFWDDNRYTEYHHQGLIDDSYRASTKEW